MQHLIFFITGRTEFIQKLSQSSRGNGVSVEWISFLRLPSVSVAAHESFVLSDSVVLK